MLQKMYGIRKVRACIENAFVVFTNSWYYERYFFNEIDNKTKIVTVVNIHDSHSPEVKIDSS